MAEAEAQVPAEPLKKYDRKRRDVLVAREARRLIALMLEFTEKLELVAASGESYDLMSRRVKPLLYPIDDLRRLASQHIEHLGHPSLTKLELRLRLADLEGVLDFFPRPK